MKRQMPDRKSSLAVVYVVGSPLVIEHQRKYSVDALTPGFSSDRQNGDGSIRLEEDLATFDVVGSPLVLEHQRKYSVDVLTPGFSSDRQNGDGSIRLEEDLATFDEKKWKGMTKAHYVDKKSRVACHECNRKFSLKNRPRHCRRCGEVFCTGCLQQKTKLNKLALPDPSGKERKVFCTGCLQQKTKLNKLALPDPSGKERKVCRGCYQNSVVTEGRCRSLTKEFAHERTMARYAHVLHQRANSLTTTFWRDQLDINTECRRLIAGFEHAVANSESRHALQEIRNLVNVPTWQQSSYWSLERRSSNCRACKGSLGVLKHRRNCRVCGLALCKPCSNKDLLVFYPDTDDTDSGKVLSLVGRHTGDTFINRPAARLAVIKQPGAPGKEPAMSLLMYVCSDCKTYIARHQTVSPDWGSSVDRVGPMAVIAGMNNHIQDLQQQVSETLASLQQRCDSLEESVQNNNVLSTKAGLHNIHFDEVDGLLTEYNGQFQRLKTLLPLAKTKTQTMLIKNYTKGRHEFFMESKQAMAQLKKRRVHLDGPISSN